MDTDRAVAVLASAHERLREAVAALPEEAWGRPTPCTEWTVRQVFQHARLGQIAYGAAAAGEPWSSVEVRFNPVDAIDGDPLALLDAALGRTLAVYTGLPAGAATVTTPLGELPCWLGATAAALDCGVHAWDIARAAGQPSPMDATLAEGLWPAAHRLADDVRDAYGVYAPALPAGQDPAAVLLAHLGRDPRWQPAG